MTNWCDVRSSLAIEPQARIKPGVFLRSSPPVTATTSPRDTSTPLPTRRCKRVVVTDPAQNCGSTAAPTTRIRDRSKLNTDALVSAEKVEFATIASNVRTSMARNCDCRNALGSVKYCSGYRYGMTSCRTPTTRNPASVIMRGTTSSGIGCNIICVHMNQVSADAARTVLGSKGATVNSGIASSHNCSS